MKIYQEYTAKNSTFTYKKFKKLLGIKEPKIPRKLKKAGRHIMTIHHRPPTTQLEGGKLMTRAYVGWQTIDGYPYTKWVRRYIWKVRNEYCKAIKNEMQRMVDEMIQPIDMEELKRRTENFKIKI